MLEALHVVKLATAVVDDVRRRIQQEICSFRGRKNDPVFRIWNTLRSGTEHVTERQRAGLEAAFAAADRHVEVKLAWRCAQTDRHRRPPSTHVVGKQIAIKGVGTFAACPVPGRSSPEDREDMARVVPAQFDASGSRSGATVVLSSGTVKEAAAAYLAVRPKPEGVRAWGVAAGTGVINGDTAVVALDATVELPMTGGLLAALGKSITVHVEAKARAPLLPVP